MVKNKLTDLSLKRVFSTLTKKAGGGSGEKGKGNDKPNNDHNDHNDHNNSVPTLTTTSASMLSCGSSTLAEEETQLVPLVTPATCTSHAASVSSTCGEAQLSLSSSPPTILPLWSPSPTNTTKPSPSSPSPSPSLTSSDPSPPRRCCDVKPEVSLFPDNAKNKNDITGKGQDRMTCSKCQARQTVLMEMVAGTLRKRVNELENEMKDDECINKEMVFIHNSARKLIFLLRMAARTLEQRDEKNETLSIDTCKMANWMEGKFLSAPLKEEEEETMKAYHSMMLVEVNNGNDTMHHCKHSISIPPPKEKVPTTEEDKGIEKENEHPPQPAGPSPRKNELHKAMKKRMRLIAMAEAHHRQHHDTTLTIADDEEAANHGGQRYRYPHRTFALGQRAHRSEMEIPSSTEDALVKIARLREGDGAWLKRRRRQRRKSSASKKKEGTGGTHVWTYATLKECREDGRLVFAVDGDGAEKSFSARYCAKFIRIVATNAAATTQQQQQRQEHEDAVVIDDVSTNGNNNAPSSKSNNKEGGVIHRQRHGPQEEDDNEPNVMERTRGLIESHPIMKHIMWKSRLMEADAAAAATAAPRPNEILDSEYLDKGDHWMSTVMLDNGIVDVGGGSKESNEDEKRQRIAAIYHRNVSMHSSSEEHIPSQTDLPVPSVSSLPLSSANKRISCECEDADTEETSSMFSRDSAFTVKHSNSQSQ